MHLSLPHWLIADHLTSLQRGIEKEGLRMAHTGYLSQTPHPKALGSKLSHPYITTDYAESLLELITPPCSTIDEALAFLGNLHCVVQHALPTDELLWALSMPCMLADGDEDIILADYGCSNIGRLKTLYRSGLGVRYGRKMQTIAGLHYNFSVGDALFEAWYEVSDHSVSFADFKNAKYLALIRNFKRLSPIVLYLTGASPSVCACFVKGKDHKLQPLSEQRTSYYRPNATSLRMGKLGYTNSIQEDLDIRYNDLGEYVKGLQKAVQTPFADFTAIGVDDNDGNPIQINDHILQIENEFYSPIRPKQPTQADETPSEALAKRGIAYVEFRAIDLDPYEPLGIGKNTACFLEILALYCLLLPSAPLLPDEEQTIAHNIETIVNHGRDDKATISVDGKMVNFRDWLVLHLSAMTDIAKLFDDAYQTQAYAKALMTMQTLAKDSNLTPSARLIADSLHLGSTWQAGKALSDKHRQTLLATPMSDEDWGQFEQIAKQSWDDQTALEQADTMPFEQYLQSYRRFDTPN